MIWSFKIEMKKYVAFLYQKHLLFWIARRPVIAEMEHFLPMICQLSYTYFFYTLLAIYSLQSSYLCTFPGFHQFAYIASSQKLAFKHLCKVCSIYSWGQKFASPLVFVHDICSYIKNSQAECAWYWTPLNITT